MTGRWLPQMQQAFQAGAGMGPAAGGFQRAGLSELLTQQLENISKRIDDLEKADE